MFNDSVYPEVAALMQRPNLTNDQHLARVLFLLGDCVSTDTPGDDIDRALRAVQVSYVKGQTVYETWYAAMEELERERLAA